MDQSSIGAARAAIQSQWAQRYGTAWTTALTRRARTAAAGTAPATSGRVMTHSGPQPAELLTLPMPPLAVRVLGNMAYGPTATSLAEFNALGSNDDDRFAIDFLGSTN